jgi:hypothetical protein
MWLEGRTNISLRWNKSCLLKTNEFYSGPYYRLTNWPFYLLFTPSHQVTPLALFFKLNGLLQLLPTRCDVGLRYLRARLRRWPDGPAALSGCNLSCLSHWPNLRAWPARTSKHAKPGPQEMRISFVSFQPG